MLSKLLTILSFAFVFSTPYPYMLMFGITVIIFAWCGAFLKIKNGAIGYLVFTAAVGALVTGMIELSQHWNCSDGTHLDNKTVYVLGINRNGFLLNSGERIIPAGIVMPKLRHLRELTNRVMPMLEDVQVKLTWDDEMNGYRMLADDKDMSEFLVVNGLAKPNEDATLELHELAETAKKDRLGVWSRPFLMEPRSPLWTAVIYYSYNLLQWALFTGCVFLWVLAYNAELKHE